MEFPAYRALDADQRSRLHQLVQVFIGDKRFEGAGGLQMTDEIRVMIAAQACMLLLGMNPDVPFPGLRSIIVYPRAYFATMKSVSTAGVVTEETTRRAGESWSHVFGMSSQGPVVLAWDQVTKGASDPSDARNVVFHEFAHQLDSHATGMDGAPVLGSRTSYSAWARVLGREYRSLRRELSMGRRGALRSYAATNPAEFFAVATETYFERPGALREANPELYEQLRAFYGWEPSSSE
jgi:Mlc titration factor MtfA (ptsG expression regulator)